MDTLELSFQRVSKALDFPFRNADGVNDAYARWRSSNAQTDKITVDIWTYCFVSRYFHHVSRRCANMSKADRDLLVEDALQRAVNAHKSVRCLDKYASWVSVVCRNVFASYQRQQVKRLQDGEPAQDEAQIDYVNYGSGRECFSMQIEEAVERLPPFLAAVTRLRFIDGLSYADISRQTGKSIETIRAYISKSLKRLRNDPCFKC